MPQVEWLIPMGIGIGFVILGVILVVIGRSDEGAYFTSLSTRPDMRRYVEQQSPPEFTSLKVGGGISIAVGLVLLVIGGVLWHWG